jgi:very-short-patch-repair endonuclease
MERWLEVASRQHGLVTRPQLLRIGFNDDGIWHRLKTQLLEEALPGVYRLRGTSRTWEQRVMAACLWGGPGACASHKSAAALWGFDGFAPGPVEVSTLKQNRTQLAFKVHRTLVEPAFITRKLGIPVTNAFRTVRDLVAVVDEHRANQLLDEALRKGLVSMEALWRMVDREAGSGRRGVGVLRHLLEQRSPGYRPSASQLQAATRRLLVAAGIAFVEEFVVTDDDGNFVARVDFKLVDAPVVVESDGRANHSSKLDWQHDLDRRNLLTALGLGVIHVTWDKVRNRPDEFLAEVAQAEATRGESQLRRRT